VAIRRLGYDICIQRALRAVVTVLNPVTGAKVS